MYKNIFHGLEHQGRRRTDILVGFNIRTRSLRESELNTRILRGGGLGNNYCARRLKSGREA